MPNPRLANRYAKSLVDLAQERNQLETVYADMLFLQKLCKTSKEFVAVMKSPIITSDKKNNVLTAITTGKVSEITQLFNKLLVNKGREFELPEIVNAFIDQYNQINDIHKVQITTAVEITETLKQEIVNKVIKETGFSKVELETKTDDKLIGGFVMEYNNMLVDASVLRDLKDIKKQFDKNLFIQALR
ncbi:MAG: ATP synthase F1 subunit delta [Chitinophagaceae bacterium]|nr:ATP synthase F1 subunit delta [Chitinophagaceae bacterium]